MKLSIVILSSLVICLQSFAEKSDSLFSKARLLGSKGEYGTALSICDTILNLQEDHVDALLLKGLLWSWLKECDSAAYYLRKARSLNGRYKDIYSAMINMWKWCNEPDSLEATLLYAKSVFPNEPEFNSAGTSDDNSGRHLKMFSTILLITDFFGKHGPAEPWQTLEIYHKLDIKRLTLVPSVKISRRIYSNVPLYGADYCLGAVLKVKKILSLTASAGASPYKYVDTLYPMVSASAGALLTPEAPMEISMEMNYRDYKKTSSVTLTTRCAAYPGRSIMSLQIWATPYKSRFFISTVGEIGYTSKRSEQLFVAVKSGLGKGPPDAASRDDAEYVFVMGLIHGSFPLTRKLSVSPLFEIRKEQYGNAFPYLHISCGAGVKWHW